MEESYETFEEELGPPRPHPPPQKPVRQIRRPEMYATRKVREEMAQFPQQPRPEPKISTREPSYPQTTPLHKDSSSPNLTQIETPWENVTLNRCLFVAITILVLTSGLQRLHETLRGQRTVAEEEEEVGLTVRQSGTLRHRGHSPEPETTLWEVMFWWLPDLDDEEDEDDDDDDDNGQVKRVKSKRGEAARASRSLRNKPLPEKKLLKQREGELKDRRAKKARDEEIRHKKQRDKKEQPEEATAADEEDGDVGNEEAEPEKNNKPAEKKEKKKTQKG